MGETTKRKILIVEDDPFLLQMYVTKMEMAGHDVLQAETGSAGLKAAQDNAPELVLLDILLPELDGFEVLRAMQDDERLKGTPVILLTNLGQKEDIEKGLELGAVDYLIKAHFTPQEVMEKIDKALGAESGKG